jgi:DinB superfamily
VYDAADMDPNADAATLLAALADTPARIEAVAERLSAAELTAAPSAGGWSPNEILWHIRATADVYGEHIARILDEETPRWRHVSPRARMKKARYDELPFAESFAAFARQRRDLVALLESLGPEAWQRAALVRDGERESRPTLQERAWRLAAHEQIHWSQMKETASAMRQV